MGVAFPIPHVPQSVQIRIVNGDGTLRRFTMIDNRCNTEDRSSAMLAYRNIGRTLKKAVKQPKYAYQAFQARFKSYRSYRTVTGLVPLLRRSRYSLPSAAICAATCVASGVMRELSRT